MHLLNSLVEYEMPGRNFGLCYCCPFELIMNAFHKVLGRNILSFLIPLLKLLKQEETSEENLRG